LWEILGDSERKAAKSRAEKLKLIMYQPMDTHGIVAVFDEDFDVELPGNQEKSCLVSLTSKNICSEKYTVK
jgi:hypothetical protein